MWTVVPDGLNLDRMNTPVQRFQLDTVLEGRLQVAPGQLTVLPLRFDGTGNGIYADVTASLVKDLRAEGVHAEFLDSSELRRFEVRKSAVLTGAIFIGVAIAQGASYDLAKAAFLKLIRRVDTAQPMTVKFVQIEESGAATAWRITGSSEHVVKAIEALPPAPPQLPPT